MDLEGKILTILKKGKPSQWEGLLLTILPQKYVTKLLKDIKYIDDFYTKKLGKGDSVYKELSYEDSVLNLVDEYREETQEL